MTDKEIGVKNTENETKSESIIPGDTLAQEGASMGVCSPGRGILYALNRAG